MASLDHLVELLKADFGDINVSFNAAVNEVTLEVDSDCLLSVMAKLKDNDRYRFEQLIDLCGVDYSQYGQSEWATESTTETGFSRGTSRMTPSHVSHHSEARFAVVYHLLSIKFNQRLRVRTYPQGEPPKLNSVIPLWPGANWFEREAFDLFGILFDNHPDLRRILTDYGFIGHPFRKDFPLIGNVEVRYDAAAGRVIYEPVSITPRTLVPKVIRDDNRYLAIEQNPPKTGNV